MEVPFWKGKDRRGISRPQDGVVSLQSGMVNSGEDVFALEKRIILKDLVEGGAGADQLQDILHTKAVPTDARATATFAFLDGNSAETLRVHGVFPISKYLFPSAQTNGKARSLNAPQSIDGISRESGWTAFEAEGGGAGLESKSAESVRAAEYQLDGFSVERLMNFLTALDRDVEILIGAKRAANEAQVKGEVEVNLEDVISFVQQFIQKADGGARLVAVWGAFTALLSERSQVKAYSPNMADLYAKTAGDVEVYDQKVLVSASECKQRPMNLDDVKHGLSKALKRGVPEYNFVISAGIVAGQAQDITKAIKANAGEVDSSIIDINKQLPILAGMLNPVRRGVFGGIVVEFLRGMRKFDSANDAATLWNVITK